MPINDEKRKINVTEWSVFKLFQAFRSVVILYIYIYIYNVSCTISEEIVASRCYFIISPL